MHAPKRARGLTPLFSLLVALLLSLPIAAASSQVQTAHAAAAHMSIGCDESPICTEVQETSVFGANYYIGHDEPSTLFYSNQPGSGNQMVYTVKLPRDPMPGPGNVPKAGQSFNFELHPAFWFGMAMCDTQSYPEQVSTCAPDSDSNIFNGQDAAHPQTMHPGTAFMEMQFYPPGWATWPAGLSCDAHQWCAALNIDSLAEDPVNGTVLNTTCQNIIGSIEYVNFAFITHNGHSQAPASPVNANGATFTPDPTQDLFMNSGDSIVVRLHDTAHGLRIDLIDQTSGQSGSMTASAANGFGQVQYDPTGTSCNNIPYDFHPMYSTSSEQTNVPWAAHTYNIAFADEIGHFQECNGPGAIQVGGACPAGNTEYDGEATDANDQNCFPASASSLVMLNGCLELNGDTGFDSLSYQTLWPDGSRLHPTPILFTSPLTRGRNYQRVAFETDLPRIEVAALEGACDRTTGTGCTRIPTTDDGQPASFYPFFSIHQGWGGCEWLIGNDVPGLTTNDFGGNAQWGNLFFSTYLAFGGHGATIVRTNNFQQVLNFNPCKARG